jgi:ANTAR domain/GAF domain
MPLTADQSLQGLAVMYAEIGQGLIAHETQAGAFAAIAEAAVDRVPGAEWASITQGRNGSFRTLAATDPRAEALDKIQYDLDAGPCVDAVLEKAMFATGDLADDTRWPGFARRATETSPVRSVLAFRLFLEDADAIAGLNLYATKPDAFGETSALIGTLLATHGALAVAAAGAKEIAAGLRVALDSNRDIGVAMGIVMVTYKVTRNQAFDLLRVASQHANRKLRDVATQVVDTGTLDLS